MKFSYLLMFFFLISCKSFAQKTTYAYDEAGNRIKREIVISKQQAFAKKASGKTYSDMISEHKVEITPSPTKGKLKVSVFNANSDFDVRVYSSTGQAIGIQQSARDYTEIDLTNHPNGMYILVISLGQEETTWKIIKTN
jgi:YD repeat-containing protein